MGKYKILIFLFLILSIKNIKADGGFIPYSYSIEEANQIALIKWDGKQEELTILPNYKGDAEEFLWVVPLPSKPEIDTLSKKLFEELNEMTTPVEENYGCGIPTYKEGTDEQDAEIIEKGVLSIYDYTVWKVKNDTTFIDKLDSMNYKIPEGLDTTIKYYTEKEWYYFAVITIKKGEQTDGLLTPVKFKFSSDTCIYPLHISQISAAEEMKIILFVGSKNPLQICSSSYMYTMFATEITESKREKMEKSYPVAASNLTDVKYLYRFSNDYYTDYDEDIKFCITDTFHDKNYRGMNTGEGWIVILILTALFYKFKKKK